MRSIAILLAAFLLTGCSVTSYTTSVETDDQMGWLSFQVRPDEAKVYVDDEFVGLAKYFDGKKRRLKIQPGEHVVRITHPGYKDAVRRVYMSDTEETFRYDLARDLDSAVSGAVIRT